MRGRLILVAVACVALSACGGSSNAASSAQATPTTTTTVRPCGPNESGCTSEQVIAAVIRYYEKAGATASEAACLARITGTGKSAVNQAFDVPKPGQQAAAIRCVGSEARLRTLASSLDFTPDPLSSVGHAADIANAIKAADLGCRDLEHVPDAGAVGDTIADRVSCEIDDDTIEITVFQDHQAMVDIGPQLHQASCYVATQRPPNTTYPPNLTYVIGDNWIVFPEKASTAEKVATAIGGSLRTNKC